MVSRERATQVVRGGSIVQILFERTIARCELPRTARARRHVVIGGSDVSESHLNASLELSPPGSSGKPRPEC